MGQGLATRRSPVNYHPGLAPGRGPGLPSSGEVTQLKNCCFTGCVRVGFGLAPPWGPISLVRPYQGLLPLTTPLPGSQELMNPSTTLSWDLLEGMIHLLFHVFL